MPNCVNAPIATIWEQQSVFAMARIQGNSGVNITQASLTSILYKVYDVKNGNTLVGSGTLVISATVFDTLVTADTNRWKTDAIGYNFGGTIPAACFPLGDKTYLVEITFDPVSGDDFYFVLKVNTRELQSKA